MESVKSAAESSGKVQFKKLSNFNRKRGSNRRAANDRSSGSDSDNCESSSSVVKSKRGDRRKNALFQSTGGYQKKMRKDSDSDSDKSTEDKAALLSMAYKASGTSRRVGPSDSGATATIEIDTEYDRDATAIRKKAIEVNKEMKDKSDDKAYRGLQNYQQFYEKKDSVLGNAGSGLNTKGPVRAATNIRSTTRWDYEPCICKDWKETGFCGFGDSCKFLHDRSDYKFGWQVERQMEEGTYHSEDMRRYVVESSGSESDDEDLPFRCFICRESFVDPIVTKCKHYFCEKCALDFYRKKSTRCYVCGEPTGGVFNPAKEIVRKIKRLSEKRNKQNSDSDEDEIEHVTTFTSIANKDELVQRLRASGGEYSDSDEEDDRVLDT